MGTSPPRRATLNTGRPKKDEETHSNSRPKMRSERDTKEKSGHRISRRDQINFPPQKISPFFPLFLLAPCYSPHFSPILPLGHLVRVFDREIRGPQISASGSTSNISVGSPRTRRVRHYPLLRLSSFWLVLALPPVSDRPASFSLLGRNFSTRIRGSNSLACRGHIRIG